MREGWAARPSPSSSIITSLIDRSKPKVGRMPSKNVFTKRPITTDRPKTMAAPMMRGTKSRNVSSMLVNGTLIASTSRMPSAPMITGTSMSTNTMVPSALDNEPVEPVARDTPVRLIQLSSPAASSVDVVAVLATRAMM